MNENELPIFKLLGAIVLFFIVSISNGYWLISAIIAAVFLFVSYYGLTSKNRRTNLSNKKNEKSQEQSLNVLMKQFGESKDDRNKKIDDIFDKKNGEINFSANYFCYQSTPPEINIKFDIRRSVAGMSSREREAIRSLLLLYNESLHISEKNTWNFILAIVWGDGKGSLFEGGKVIGLDKNVQGAIDWLWRGGGVEASVDAAIAELNHAMEKNPDNPVVKKLAARMLGTGGDLEPAAPLSVSAISDVPGSYLVVGNDPTEKSKLWGYSGEGSLITVAPPGSGKTQCHVIPNLLTWRGPAVVLDIKGEIYEKTSGWRAANVGPVYKFSPLDPENSHAYNPLTGVSSDPDHIWEDSRFVADMLIVPSNAKDPFWENKARDVLTAAIASIAYAKSPEKRNMAEVLDILHGVGWDRFILSLQAATDVPTMARSGRSLGEMEPKTRDGVLQSALASLSAWEGARIARATARSDWQPFDLRSGRNPTVYICINPNEIDSYASLLRVVIAQHIRALTAKLPERGGLPILFILDELPRLRRMPPVEEALEIGRQYGIKLWMFTQSLGQMQNAYDNADGMVGSCALRMFMNPSLFDETAQKLSDDMGYRESVIDGTRVKRVEPQVLAGPDFKDAVIVMASNAPPARVDKHFAYADPELKARMEIPPAR